MLRVAGHTGLIVLYVVCMKVAYLATGMIFKLFEAMTFHTFLKGWADKGLVALGTLLNVGVMST